MTSRASSRILALIPARGGSKSIPRKNLLMMAGRPLIAYSIEQALRSQYISRTIVSTDDPEIADVAKSCGAEVPFMRPAEFAQDLSPDIDVFRHALTWLRDEEGAEYDMVVHLRPTGPVRRVELIDKAIEVMRDRPDADSLRSVSVPTETPFKMWRIRNGYLESLLEVPGMAEPYCAPRQTLPDVYWQNGYVDIVRPHVVLEDGLMCGRTILPFPIDEPIFELDYAESVPKVEAAISAVRQGVWPAGPRAHRHPV